MTWRLLFDKANQAKDCLDINSVKQNDVVVLIGRPSAEFVAWMFGVWLIGAVLVPMDSSMPSGRRNQLLEQLPAHFCLLRLSEKNPHPQWTTGLEKSLSIPDNLCAVIFTSGSSGLPKPVMLAWQGVNSYVASLISQFGLKSSDVFLHQMTPGFDGHIAEVLIALKLRSSMAIVHGDTWSASACRETIEQSLVTAAVGGGFVPILLEKVLQLGRLPLCLRKVQVGGDRVTSELIEPL